MANNGLVISISLRLLNVRSLLAVPLDVIDKHLIRTSDVCDKAEGEEPLNSLSFRMGMVI